MDDDHATTREVALGMEIQPGRHYVVRKATEPRGPRSPGRRGAVVEGQPREGFESAESARAWLTGMVFFAFLRKATRGLESARTEYEVLSGEEIFASASR